MEHQTSFDLKRAVVDWHREIASQPGLAPEEAHELEAHLLECVAELRHRDLSEEEAFWLARHRLGSPERLGEEFAKANPARIWRERVLWMVIAALALDAFGAFSNSIWAAYVRFALPAPDFSWLRASWFALTAAVLSHLVTAMLIIMPIMAVRGQFHALATQISGLLRTRARVALACAALVLASHALDLMIFCENWHRTLPAQLSTDTAFMAFIIGMVCKIFFPFCLIGLLLWLVPSRTEECATSLACR